ncbi:hypothetical protein [Microbacterium lacticum]
MSIKAVTGPPGSTPDAIGDALAVAHRLDAELSQVVEVALGARADDGCATMLGQLRLETADASGCRGDHSGVVGADFEGIQGVQRRRAGEEEATRGLAGERLRLVHDRCHRHGDKCRVRARSQMADDLRARREIPSVLA